MVLIMKKIIMLGLILIFTIGIVSATDLDLNSIKAPDSYKISEEDSLFSSLSDLEINFEEFKLYDINETDEDSEDVAENHAFANNTDFNYTVVPGDINNTFNFTDDLNKMYGCVELIEINNHKYTVMIWGNTGTPDEIISNATQCLEKLNELNDFKPIDTSSYI